MHPGRLIAVLLLLLLLAPPAPAADKFTVAVASNVKFAFDDISAAFTQDTGIAVEAVFSSSGKIVAQVKAGAPYAVFLSGDMAYPEQLHRAGFSHAAPRPYAYGKLVVWTKSGPLNPDAGLSVLTTRRIKRLAIANPKFSPYGQQAMHALEKLGLGSALRGKLVYAENIAQVVQYVDSGNVDAGITAKSLVIAPEMAGKGYWIDLPPTAYRPIAQGAIMLSYGQARQAETTKKFYEFIYSARARAILARFDYGLP